MELTFLGAALAVAVAGACCDIATARIPNRLTYPAIIAGLGLRLALIGWRGLLGGVLGLLLGGGVFFVFHMVHAMGGGDVKLMAAVGALMGLPNTGVTMLACAMCGGVMAIVYMVARGRFRSTLANLLTLLQFHTTTGLEMHPELNLSNPSALRMPYGVAIAAGCAYTFSVALWAR